MKSQDVQGKLLPLFWRPNILQYLVNNKHRITNNENAMYCTCIRGPTSTTHQGSPSSFFKTSSPPNLTQQTVSVPLLPQLCTFSQSLSPVPLVRARAIIRKKCVRAPPLTSAPLESQNPTERCCCRGSLLGGRDLPASHWVGTAPSWCSMAAIHIRLATYVSTAAPPPPIPPCSYSVPFPHCFLFSLSRIVYIIFSQISILI
jgi:hypothetical protein